MAHHIYNIDCQYVYLSGNASAIRTLVNNVHTRDKLDVNLLNHRGMAPVFMAFKLQQVARQMDIFLPL